MIVAIKTVKQSVDLHKHTSWNMSAPKFPETNKRKLHCGKLHGRGKFRRDIVIL